MGANMNQSDKIYLGKLFVDYTDAIDKTEIGILKTGDMVKAIIEGLKLDDNRTNELNGYKNSLEQFFIYVDKNGISFNELVELGEKYKTLTFGEFMKVKSEITIKEELDTLLNK